MTEIVSSWVRWSWVDEAESIVEVDYRRAIVFDVEKIIEPRRHVADIVVGFRIESVGTLGKEMRKNLVGRTTTMELRIVRKPEVYGLFFEHVTWDVPTDPGKICGLAQYVEGPSSHPALRALAPAAESSLMGMWRVP